MKTSIYFIIIILLTSCAKLPIESVTLTEAIIEEGKRMHELNIMLINKMFKSKSEEIDLFIKEEYTPKHLENFKNNIPDNIEINYEKEFPNMLRSIIPEINTQRDIMQNALEQNRIKIINKLNKDYQLYNEAANELKNLLVSAVKVNEERTKALQQVTSLINTNIDIDQIESQIDGFIYSAGDIGNNINNFNNSINSLLKN